MSIRPIDLQVMFMRMAELSREQSIAQDAVARKQAAQNEAVSKTSKENDQRVSKLDEVPEGPEPIGEKESGTPERKRKSLAKAAIPNAEEPTEPAADPLRDPDLGNTIDIIG